MSALAVRGTHLLSGFTAESWQQLSTRQRIVACHRYALEAEQMAEAQSRPEVRQQFRKVAERWHLLAAEIEVER
jgi:hypothetical protein